MPRRFPNLFFRRKKPYRPEDDTNLEVTPDYRRRLAALYGVLLACILIFAAALYNAQVVNGADYYATSASRIAQEEDVEAFGASVSVMNTQAYAIAAVQPAQDREENVREALQGYINRQQSNFQFYLPDQYQVAQNARLETLSDGTVLLVMCQDADNVFDSIRAELEQA